MNPTETLHINVRHLPDGSVEVIITLGDNQDRHIIPADKIAHIKVPLYVD